MTLYETLDLERGPMDLIGFYPEERNFFTGKHRFARLADGSVLVDEPGGDRLHIDRDSWCSLVAAMSDQGGTSDTYAGAQALHGERQEPPK